MFAVRNVLIAWQMTPCWWTAVCGRNGFPTPCMTAAGRVLTCGVVPTFSDPKFSIGGFREILGTAAPGQEPPLVGPRNRREERQHYLGKLTFQCTGTNASSRPFSRSCRPAKVVISALAECLFAMNRRNAAGVESHRGLHGDDKYAPAAEQRRKGDDEMDNKEEGFAYGANGSMAPVRA
jgi:hypothetical protein